MSNTTEQNYNSLLDSFMACVDTYVQVSLAVRDGRIPADEAIKTFDDYMGPVATLLMLMDLRRGEGGFFARGGTAATRKAREDEIVDDFAAQLGLLPEADKNN